jgi:hypothetical protein
VTENTARMRIERALAKLRTRLATRGIASTAAALETAMAQNAVSSAPAALASRVVTSAASIEVASAPWFTTASLSTKLALASLALAVLVSFALLPKPATVPAISSEGASRQNQNNVAQTTAADAKSPVSGSAQAVETFSGPELFFVDAATSMPVTNQTIWLRGWERGSETLVEKRVQHLCLAWAPSRAASGTDHLL